MTQTAPQSESDTQPLSSPSKRWRQHPWWVRYLTYLGAFLALLIATYAFFDIRGRMRWKEYFKADLNSDGEWPSLSELIKDKPTDDCFWNDQFIQDLIASRVDLSDIESVIRSTEPTFEWTSQSSTKVPGVLWPAAQKQDLSLFTGATLTRTEAAEKFLTASSALQPEWNQLRSSTLKPATTHPWTLGSVDEMMRAIPFDVFLKIQRYLQITALARIEIGENDLALEDALTSLELSRQLQHEGLLINHLVCSSFLRSLYQVLWEGTNARVWNDSQLQKLDRALSQIQTDSFREILERESAFSSSYAKEKVDGFFQRWDFYGSDMAWKAEPLVVFPPLVTEFLSFFPSASPVRSSGNDLDALNRLFLASLPKGISMENGIFSHRLSKRTLLNPSLPLAERIDREQDAIDATLLPDLRDPRRIEVVIPYGPYLRFYSDSQLWIQIARVALAAERYRISNGEYPEEWSDLVPEWLPEVPEDVWANPGTKLRYQLDADDRPVIYSVGENGVDDGGVPHNAREKGDLVWRYSLPSGYTVDDYLK